LIVALYYIHTEDILTLAITLHLFGKPLTIVISTDGFLTKLTDVWKGWERNVATVCWKAVSSNKFYV